MAGYLVIEDSSMGRMCNRLGLFAHVLAAAKECDRRVIDMCFWPYAKHFSELRGGAVIRNSGFTVPLPANRVGLGFAKKTFTALKRAGVVSSTCGVLEDGELLPDKEIDLEELLSTPESRSRKLISLNGWRFRAFAAVARQQQFLRKVFSFAPHIVDEGKRLITIERSAGLPLLGMHVRQTDYASHLGGKHLFEIGQYFEMARKVIHEQGPYKLVVFSDGPIHTPPKFESEMTFAADFAPTAQRDLVELFMMAHCDRLIGPHSSFNQWASFFGQTPLQTIERCRSGYKLTASRIALPLDFGARESV